MIQELKFSWPAMRVALEGHSYLDVPRLSVQNKAEAKTFLVSYGYDIDDPLIREELWRIYFQSVSFLKDTLLDPGERMPEAYLSRGGQSDIVKLVLDASENSQGGRSERGKWACAILRIMHIISHLDNDVRLENFNHARKQIFERFDQHIHSAGKRRWKFGEGPDSVPLVRFIRKERKERNSILIKLLSKPHNVVEEIYDRIGFRFVTESRFDCYRLLQKMFNSGVVSVPNIQPGRSVNSLIPLEILQENVESTYRELKSGEISAKLAKRKIQKLEEESLVPIGMMRNPYSSRWYRAIQFTCRQLITAPDPTFQFWKQIEEGLKKSREATSYLKKIPISLRERRAFYYPFEIQVMDLESYIESIGGRSRHREYKAKQRLMARNRVLRDLV